MKISNELLSWVMGCECEFLYTDENNLITFKPDHVLNIVTDSLSSYCNARGGHVDINIDTFIRIAKIKAFEAGYNIIEFGNQACVRRYGEYIKDCTSKPNSNCYYLRVDVIEALEWVKEQIK